jgi:hypothetical protein
MVTMLPNTPIFASRVQACHRFHVFLTWLVAEIGMHHFIDGNQIDIGNHRNVPNRSFPDGSQAGLFGTFAEKWTETVAQPAKPRKLSNSEKER